MRRRAFWLPLCVLALLARPAVGSDLVDFARCLTRAGATFYSADWCPHCAAQIRMFGNAIGHVRMVDCTAGCEDIHSFPTWTFAGGSRLSGVASFDVLSRRTGCPYGQPRREQDEDDDRRQTRKGVRETANGDQRERFIGGAKIIDVPGR